MEAVLDTDTSGCFTAASALGFGKIKDRWMLDMDLYYAMLSCGMKDRGMDVDLRELITAASKQGVAPQNALHTMLEGEGFKRNSDMEEDVDESILSKEIWEDLVA